MHAPLGRLEPKWKAIAVQSARNTGISYQNTLSKAQREHFLSKPGEAQNQLWFNKALKRVWFEAGKSVMIRSWQISYGSMAVMVQ
jgi:hypothetical protein